MKCEKDCFNCKLPVSKCHGGDYKSSTDWKGANRIKDGKGSDFNKTHRLNHKINTRGWSRVDLH